MKQMLRQNWKDDTYTEDGTTHPVFSKISVSQETEY